MNKQTQHEKLKEYFRKHWFITRYEAATRLGVMNLWQRVSELEKKYGVFDRRNVKTKEGKKVMQYWPPKRLREAA